MNLLQEFINQLDPETLPNGYFQLISSHTDHMYPPRSPDLTPLDYSLFPTLKNTIFKQSVDTI